MKVNVIKSSENELKIEIEGAGHSILNLLQKTLLEDSEIEVAGYHVPHPLIDSGVLFVHTKDKLKPEDAILGATKKVLDLSKDFHTAFKKASKSYKAD
ncbi:MAG: DNA-directed RNA polymerase subunit L [Candidatus Bathyarchaeota archaeon]|nr:DNA-directed RNA polymerase subunit L [Candidatus Bathyarchaeum tardum]WGM89642.1 MAG: DNA-directed RNA polymerase subunit L [Candidatus Bathyarchaeum tardum]WNZ30256.1 MAG: DNA-directed RNA polymerase subunit L [Candidatus Bathyarchaeota archaeon]